MRPFDVRLARYAAATRGFLVASVVVGLAGALLLVAQATLIASSVSRAVLGGATLADLRGSLALLALVVAGRGTLAWATEVLAHRTSASVKSALRRRLVAHAVRTGPARADGQRTGDLVTLATRGVDALDGYFARYLPAVVLAAVVPLVVGLRILLADWTSALVIALTLPLVPLFMVLVGWMTARRTTRQWRRLSVLSRHFLDLLEGLPTLRAFGRATDQGETIRRLGEEHRRATLGTLRITFLSALVLELVATLSVALVAVGVGLRLVGGGLDLETALLVLVLAPEAYWPLRQVGAQYHASAEGLAAAEQVFAVLESPAPPSGTRTDVPDPARVPLRVEGLTVRYEQRDAPALDGLSLTVRPGRTVAVVGPSGSGKSTLLGVLLGFVAPSGGRVLVGEGERAVDLGDLDAESWRLRIAYVPQRPTLFSGTVAANIRLGAPQASDDAVRNAARLSGAEEFVDALPGGFAHRLGDGGTGLSAGQRQRIALARAFLRDAPLLLLDEPTANLDGDSESVVADAVRRLAAGRTVVLATHRPALVLDADEVVHLAPAAVAS